MPERVHEPVMVSEVLEALSLSVGCTVVDGTLGGGGHAVEMARLIGPSGMLIGMDRDPAMLAIGRERLKRDCGGGGGPRMFFAEGSYEKVGDVLGELRIDKGVDAILLDLGLNSMQLDDAERGFSFQKDGPLDGRFNPAEGGMTIADLLNTADEDELWRIFREYGDERLARPIARRVVQQRRVAPFERTSQFAELVSSVYPPAQRHGRIHPATRCMQSCRIAVNDELGAVERGVRACMGALAPGGRLAVISFHSGEDRIVKGIFREASAPRPSPDNPYSATTMEGIGHRLVHGGAIQCGEEEAERNPRARSARLRAIERLGGEASR